MKVGDLVKHFLTEQVGIVLETRKGTRVSLDAVHVLWTTQGLSLFGPGNKEWCFEHGLAVLTTT